MKRSPRYLALVFLASIGLLVTPAHAATGQPTWRSRDFIPTNRYFLGAAGAANGRVYAIGGQGTAGIEKVASNEEYDPLSNTWQKRAPLPTARGSLGVAAAPNGKIYAIGGQTNDAASLGTNLVEEYDPASNAWATKASLPQERTGVGAATAGNGKIYVAGGGRRHSSGLNELDEYDPATNTWTSKAPLPTARQYPALASATNGKLYAIGGMIVTESLSIVPLANVEEYDPATNTWSVKAALPSAGWSLAAVGAPNGKIYVLGGASLSNAVREYDPAADTWATSSALAGRHSDVAAALATNGNLYLVGGLVGIGASTTEEGTFEVATPTATATPTITATPTPSPTVTPTYTPTPVGTPAHFAFLPLGARGNTAGW